MCTSNIFIHHLLKSVPCRMISLIILTINLIGLLHTMATVADAQFENTYSGEDQHKYYAQGKDVVRYTQEYKNEQNGRMGIRYLLPCRIGETFTVCLVQGDYNKRDQSRLGHPDMRWDRDGLRHFSESFGRNKYMGYHQFRKDGPAVLLVTEPTAEFGTKWTAKGVRDERGYEVSAHYIVASGEFEGWYLDFEKMDEVKLPGIWDEDRDVPVPPAFKAKLSEKPGPNSAIGSSRPYYKKLR